MSEGIVRSTPDTTPTESEVSAPNGDPIAATGCPTFTSPDTPSGTGISLCASGATFSTPTSS